MSLPRVDIVNFEMLEGGPWSPAPWGTSEDYIVRLAQVVQSLGGQPRVVQQSAAAFSSVHQGIDVIGVPGSGSMRVDALSEVLADIVGDACVVVASPVELACRLPATLSVIGIDHGLDRPAQSHRIDSDDAARIPLLKEALGVCAVCVCTDATTIDRMRQLPAHRLPPFHYLPNAIDSGRFTAVPKQFEEGDLVVFFPRPPRVEFGLVDVASAFDDLTTRFPGATLQLLDDEVAREQPLLRAFTRRHRDRIVWIPSGTAALANGYQQSHVVMIPSIVPEGIPSCVLEALATNNAVVAATPVGGLSTVVIDGFTGVLVRPGPLPIAAALERLSADRQLTARLARNGLALAETFSLPAWEDRWRQLLRQVTPDLWPVDAITSVVATTSAPDGVPLSERAAEIDRAQLTAARERLARERQALAAELAAAQAEVAALSGAVATSEAGRVLADQKFKMAAAELTSIKSTTGWALLQRLYKLRFALLPWRSRREAAAQALVRRVRRWRRSHHLRGVEPVNPSVAITDAANPLVVSATALSATPVHYTVVCLSIIEWRFRFQRPQQLARQFAVQGHSVLFTSHAFRDKVSVRPIEAGIEELDLPGPPGLNPYRDELSGPDARRMADALLEYLKSKRVGRFVVLAQLPFWAPVALRLADGSGCDVVYDCMDLHTGFSSNTPNALASEEQLLSNADVVVVSSEPLLQHVGSRAKRTLLVRNGVDYPHFASVPDPPPPTGRPVTLGYYGAIADWFDSALVAGIAELRPDWSIVLTGSTWSGDTAPFAALSSVLLTGEKPYQELPDLLAGWDCCIIPFKQTPLTAATNPVKLYEMLAAGRPVVAVDLPELRPVAACGLVTLAEDANAFVDAVERLVREDSAPLRAQRRAFASENTWADRQQLIAGALDALCPRVSIIIVTYNNRELNDLCLASVLSDTDYQDYEVIVVDNASTDGTPELIQTFAARDSRVKLMANSENRGFAAANNQGAALATGQYLCFLNNDTVVHGSWLRALVAHLRRDAGIGLVGPVTNAIANEARIPVGYEDLRDMTGWADSHVARHAGRTANINMLAFFCVVMSRWVWQIVGPLDERFGVGMFEDDDYSRRVKDAGFSVKVAWDSFVHHWQRASYKLIGEAEYLRIYHENRGRFQAKWGTSEDSGDPMAALRMAAAKARGTVVFPPSVGWDIPLAQRPHHLARVLAEEGYAVVFDCSNSSDTVEVVREIEPRLFLFKGEAGMLSRLPRVTLWTLSYNYDYRDRFPNDTPVIYDWIDDLSVFPYDQRRLRALHDRGMLEARVVACVARQLHLEAVSVRPDALYVPNGVELPRFQHAPEPNPARTDDEFASVLAAGRPIVGYYGALARWFDYSLLARTATLRPDWSFVLIGPDHDGTLETSGVRALPNVFVLGPRPYRSLPGFLHLFDVATIPFVINEITLATSPLKLYEYFAAARPVISTPMPECAAFSDVRVVASAETFAVALDEARAAGTDPALRARLVDIAAQNTWLARARSVMDAVAQAAG